MISTYLLLPLSILLVLLYLISFMLMKFGVFRLNLHRKIWNTILLLTFMVTATLGLLIAVQINYKLEWSIVKKLLNWHVNIGIAMSFVAIFHLIWHLRYYFNLFIRNNQEDSSNKSITITELPKSKLKYLILLLGFLSITVQVLLIREVGTVFEGNELMLGWTLGIWMLLTGIGTFLGKSSSSFNNVHGLINNILLFICVLPVAMMILLSLIKAQLFPPGILANPIHLIIIVLIILAPICLLIGYSYSLFVRVYNDDKNSFSIVYALECLGSLFGGFVVSFIMIGWLSILESLLIITALSIVLIYVFSRKKHYLAYLFTTIVTLLIFLIYPIDELIKNPLFPNQIHVEGKETRFGNITVTETAGQYNFFGNGSLLFTTDNTIGNEENVHYAMLQNKNPQSILMVSGGIAGMLDEVLKYPSVINIDYVELNPDLIGIGKKYKPLPVSSKINIYSIDGKRFIYKTDKRYDIVIFAIPDPSSIQINRFYSDEFIHKLKSKLNRNAVIIYSLTSSGNYISPNKANIEASLYHTLKNSFNNVDIIPGEKDYFIASDSLLQSNISELSILRGIDNKYVNQFYIDDFTTQQRSEFIKNSIINNKIVNTDNKPLPVFYEYLHFLSHFSGIGTLWLLLPILVLIAPLFMFKNISKSIYIAGFSASTIELLIIFSFQIVYGFAYSAIGMIIAIFMAGLALGALIAKKIESPHRFFLLAQVGLGLFVLIFPVVNNLLKEVLNSFLTYFIFSILTLIPSILVGFIYVSGTRLMPEDTPKFASVNYSADLIGSALGIVALTIILIPILGVVNSCFVIAGLNFLGVILTFGSMRNIFSK